MDTADNRVLQSFEGTGVLANDLTGIKMRGCETYLYFKFELTALEMKI